MPNLDPAREVLITGDGFFISPSAYWNAINDRLIFHEIMVAGWASFKITVNRTLITGRVTPSQANLKEAGAWLTCLDTRTKLTQNLSKTKRLTATGCQPL
jgi:hypothetical protein